MTQCTLQIKRPDGLKEIQAVFYGGLPTPGARLTLGDEPIEVTSAGFFSRRFVVVARSLV